MKVLVLGGSGFLGRRVIPRLNTSGHTVVGLARSDAATSVLRGLGAASAHGDLDVAETLDAALRDVRPDGLVVLIPLNIGHGPAIVDAAERSGVRRAVFVSTTSIYTRVRSQATPNRRIAEERILASTLDWTILRPTMIYGAPDDRNISRLLKMIRRTPVVPLPGGGRRLQQPVHVDDVARGLARALDDPHAIRNAYELAGPAPMTFRELISEASTALDKRVVTVPVPLKPLVLAARLYERLAKHPRLRAEQFERLGEDKAFDISAATRDLDFRPRTFAEGVRYEARLVFPATS